MKAVIIYQNKIVDSLIFKSVNSARKYLVMTNPKRTFIEIEENKFVCYRYGTTFKIMPLNEDEN